MWEKLIQRLIDREDELQVRLMKTVILASVIVATVGMLGMIMLRGLTTKVLILSIVMLIIMGSVLLLTFKYRKQDWAAILLGIVIIVLVFPLTFIFSGGLLGGAPLWMAIGILYAFTMFSGKKLYGFLALSVFTYCGAYVVGYFYPELIVPLPSRTVAYIDSIFAIFVVGFVCGIILKAHASVFALEHKLNQKQKEELKKSKDARNVFFANMSHEIRTPINAIIGLNEMILRSKADGEIREYALDIQSASKMLLNQVNDILDLSQMEMERMQVVPVKYQTKELFGELAELIRVQLEKKNLEFVLDIDPGLPIALIGDEKRMKQILLNLLDNAVKYTESGTVVMTVGIEDAGSEEIILKISVEDTGIGIRKEDMENIYDSFKRVDEKKNTHVTGSGLGLAITKQLVDLMGGEITVDSIYTKGTTFTVNIAQKIASNEKIGVVDFSHKKLQDGEQYQAIFEAPEARVLVVDDNRMNSLVVSKLLSFTKMQVDVALGGAECLEMTKKKYYHVILMDYMMPGMDGKETLKELRIQENGLCRESAVIALTANALSGARETYLEEGFDGYAEKPIQGRLLEAEILKFLPQDIIEYQKTDDFNVQTIGQYQNNGGRRRKKIYITSDCTCDIPAELLEKYDIKLMYLYVKTPHGRFADTREIDSDSLTQYISAESSSAFADSVTVEEFEEFFAETLTQAEQVIHLSLASRCGRTHKIAVTAAKSFDHVHVIDSGQISGGLGLLTMQAAQMAMEGKSVEEICNTIEKTRNQINTRIIMPGVDIFYQNGRTRNITMQICRLLKMHPYVALKQRKAVVAGLLMGNLESAWKQGIYWNLHNKKKVNPAIIVITHVGCSVKQQEWIKNEVLKYVPFERVIVQKTSFTNACNTGMEAVGIAYYSTQK